MSWMIFQTEYGNESGPDVEDREHFWRTVVISEGSRGGQFR